LSSNQTGSNNVAFGVNSLLSNVSGVFNTAIGTGSMLSNTTGRNNLAAGYRALHLNTEGVKNTASGDSALFNNTIGFSNTAVGKNGLLTNTSGTNNTAIGYEADVASNNLTNATAIGNGANVDSSNKIQLGNTSVTSVNTSGKLTTGLVTYPNAHGTTGQVLSTTGSGELSWINQSAGAVSSLGAIGDSSTTNGATITSGVLSLAPADTSNGGIVTTGAQTFAGNKIFNANVGIGTATPAASAQLDVSSTSKGFLPPRMTTVQRDAITSPVAGLIVYNITTSSLEIRNSSAWVSLGLTAPVALPTIQIGNQLWSKENLDVAFYRNGDPIPQVTDPTAWASLTTGAWCYYNNDPENGAIYGKLYNWYAVNDARGLAPQGWHVPTDAEWTTLGTKLGGDVVAGGKMKVAGTTRWTTPNTGADNSSGFAGLPGSYRFIDGGFSGVIGESGNWWSSTQDNAVSAWCRILTNFAGNINRLPANKRYGYSVRCVRD
jgi:uncharacterized protein (TIGR02145 family)